MKGKALSSKNENARDVYLDFRARISMIDELVRGVDPSLLVG